MFPQDSNIQGLAKVEANLVETERQVRELEGKLEKSEAMLDYHKRK